MSRAKRAGSLAGGLGKFGVKRGKTNKKKKKRKKSTSGANPAVVSNGMALRMAATRGKLRETKKPTLIFIPLPPLPSAHGEAGFSLANVGVPWGKRHCSPHH